MILLNTDHTGSVVWLEGFSGDVLVVHLAVQSQAASTGHGVRMMAPKRVKFPYLIDKKFQVIIMNKRHITIGCLLFYPVRIG